MTSQQLGQNFALGGTSEPQARQKIGRGSSVMLVILLDCSKEGGRRPEGLLAGGVVIVTVVRRSIDTDDRLATLGPQR